MSILPSEIAIAYYDLSRYVAPRWIGKAQYNLSEGMAQEADGLEYLAGLEKVSDDWHEVRRPRCLPGWPVGARNVAKLQEGNLYIRKTWYERHWERVASNDELALAWAERTAGPPAKNISTAPVALPRPAPRVTHAPSPPPVKDTAPTPKPSPAEAVQTPVSGGLSEVIRRGSIIPRKPDAPRFPLVPDEFIPPAGFRDPVEPLLEPNYPAEDVGFTPPVGFRISVPAEPVPVSEPEPEALTVALPVPEPAVSVPEPRATPTPELAAEPVAVMVAEPEPPAAPEPPTSPEPEAVPEPKAPAVPMKEPETEAPEPVPVSVSAPASVWLPAIPPPPQMPESDRLTRPARPPRPRTSREKAGPEYDPEPAVEGGRKLRVNYAVVRDKKLRAMAIQIHGRNCCVCSFNFDAFFGPELAQGYIEIHHLSKIADGERSTDPTTDLAPLCGNCHAMADRLACTLANPPATIAELKRLLVPPKAI